MRIIGLVGGSGCGKSELAKRLLRPGVALLDADAVYHALTDRPSLCTEALADAFGPAILHDDGSLNRPALATCVFDAQDGGEKRQMLNRITHTFVTKERDKALATYRNKGYSAVLLDAPLLYEAGWDNICDAIVAVTAPYADRLARIMSRDGMTEEKARARLDAQPPDRFYTARADFVLCNEGDLTAFSHAADELAATLFEKNR